MPLSTANCRSSERHSIATGQREHQLIRFIDETLQVNNIPLRTFLDDTWPRLKRLSPRGDGNHSGFLYRRAEAFHKQTQQAPAPETADQAERRPARCQRCNATGQLPDGQYCDCRMGRELKRVKERYPPSISPTTSTRRLEPARTSLPKIPIANES